MCCDDAGNAQGREWDRERCKVVFGNVVQDLQIMQRGPEGLGEGPSSVVGTPLAAWRSDPPQTLLLHVTLASGKERERAPSRLSKSLLPLTPPLRDGG